MVKFLMKLNIFELLDERVISFDNWQIIYNINCTIFLKCKNSIFIHFQKNSQKKMNPFYSYPPTTTTSDDPQQIPYPSQPIDTTQIPQIPQPPPIIPVQQPIVQPSSQQQQPIPTQQPAIDPTNPQPIGSTEHKQEKQASAPHETSSSTITPQVEHHYHVVFSQDNPPPLTVQPPIEPRDWDKYYDEESGASSSLTLSICLAVVLACCGCFPLSCIPFWFVHSTYKYSGNRKSQSVAAIAKTLFWFTVMMNVCFCCIGVFLIVIVPPSVVVPKYY